MLKKSVSLANQVSCSHNCQFKRQKYLHRWQDGAVSKSRKDILSVVVQRERITYQISPWM
jgi:hypothetical protein